MSETEDILEPIPVTKETAVVYGNAGFDPSYSEEYQHGISKPVIDITKSISDEYKVNGDTHDEEPINGDCSEQKINWREDLIGEHELPPPPEVVPEMAIPPSNHKDLINDISMESSVDPVILESSVDLEDSFNQSGDLINMNINSGSKDETEDDSCEYPRHIDYLSEEELVSVGGLEEELQVEIKNNQENEVVESLNESQLIDSVEADETSSCSSVPQKNVLELSLHQESLNVEKELAAEVTQEEVDDEPSKVTSEQMDFQNEQQIEQHGVKVPEHNEFVAESAVEEMQLDLEMKPQEIPQPCMGYSEPDIIIDNKRTEKLLDETPPPPPPPLEEENPIPPPPLDDKILWKHVSGSSTPNKQSPVIELATPLTEISPVPVAVVMPQQEPKKASLVQKCQIPAEASPLSNSEAKTAHAQPPVAVVSPQVSDDLSPLGSPSTASEHSPSDGEKAETHIISNPQVSVKINKKNFKNKIKFGVDLVEAALKELTFISDVNKHTGLYEEWLFKKAIRRYEAFWLPLAAEHKKECLAAPLDIEWLWHCHMLAPVVYEVDCNGQVGLLVDHKAMTEKDRTKALEKSRKYWAAKYPHEKFEIDLVYQEKVEVIAPATEPTAEVTKEEKQEETAKTEVQETGEQQAGVKAEVDQPAENANQTPAIESSDKIENQVEAGDKMEEISNEANKSEPSPPPAPAQESVPTEPIIPEEGYQQRSSYDIFSAIVRQRVFHYQTSLAHFHDKHFLKMALKRYQHFLFLKHQHPMEALVPCYDVDLIWHAHQLHPSVYKYDTTKLLGQTLHHDDSVNIRVAGSALMLADQRTRELWKELFDESCMTFGAMYRGEPPVLCERMSLIVPEETYSFSTKKATVNLDKVQVEGLPEEVNKYSVRLTIGGSEKDGPMIKLLKGNKKRNEFENTKKGLAHFVFDTKDYDRIKFDMHQQLGFACTGHDEEIGEQTYNFMPVVENIPMEKTDASAFTDTIMIDEEQNLKTTFTASIEPPKQGPAMLYMNPGNFETRFCIMPEQIVEMWGPIPLPRIPSSIDSQCNVASHSFVNHTGEVIFTCRVIHCVPLIMSAVQVFYKNQMTAVAHLVGSDQIPLPAQLSDSKKIFSLNPVDDQRAMLIKNHTGDWGLVRGQWTGFRKYQPAVLASKGKKAKKEVPWSPGTLSVSFYKCATGAWQHVTLPYQQDNYRLVIQEANIDLKTGSIEINSESNQVAENLALAFSVAMLHVLCQPRYMPPAPQEAVPVAAEGPPLASSVPPEAQETQTQEKESTKEEQEPSASEKVSTEAAGQTEDGGMPAEEKPTEQGAEGKPVEQLAVEENPTVQATEQKPAEQLAVEENPTVQVTEQKPAEQALEEKPIEPGSMSQKTPKSPSKAEPATPSKKIKETPPIPVHDLALVMAAGYGIDTPSTETIKKQFGANACAGCVAVGMDVGIGLCGDVTAATQAETEVVEAVVLAADAVETSDIQNTTGEVGTNGIAVKAVNDVAAGGVATGGSR